MLRATPSSTDRAQARLFFPSLLMTLYHRRQVLILLTILITSGAISSIVKAGDLSKMSKSHLPMLADGD